MHTVVTGVGYTGRRVVSLLPGDLATGLSRPTFDLDSPPDCFPKIPLPFNLLYTVPPRSDADGDSRLESLLALLDPVPERIVYLSTSGVYGDARGALVDESRTPAPATQRAQRRLTAELELTAWCNKNEVRLVILRVPGIYGPDRLGLERIRGREPVITDAHPGNRIHVDDLAACCVQALGNNAPAGIYNVGDGDHRSSTWFTNAVAEFAGMEPPPEISRADAETELSETRLSFLNESRILDTSKMRDVLGFRPHYTDAEDGIRASLKSLEL